MSMVPILIVVFLLFTSMGNVSGFLCYNCSTKETRTCGDPFDGKNVNMIDCKTSCYKKTKFGKVSRGCSQTAAYTFSNSFKCTKDNINMDGYDVECICNEMACNISPNLCLTCFVGKIVSMLVVIITCML